jgi:murein DD-endopeptidase MepM/ murein hydrolase activator NlpD
VSSIKIELFLIRQIWQAGNKHEGNIMLQSIFLNIMSGIRTNCTFVIVFLLPFFLSGCVIPTRVVITPDIPPLDISKPEKNPSFPAIKVSEIQTFTYPVTPGTCGGYKFGDKTFSGSTHNGLDIGSGKGGDEIHATWKGTICKNMETGDNDGFGTFTVVEYKCSDIPQSDKDSMNGLCKDGQSIYVRYAHMQGKSNSGLTDGGEVKPGDKIGVVGNTGNTKGYVLHVETRIGDSDQYLAGSSGSPKYSSYGRIGESFIDPQTIFGGICEK